MSDPGGTAPAEPDERRATIAGVVLVGLVGGVWFLARRRPVRTRKYRIPDSVMAAARPAVLDRPVP